MKNKKRGFTLIELLAVIVVLAIITLLAMPKVTTLLEKSRARSFAVEANEIDKVARTYYTSRQFANDSNNQITCFTVDELISNGYLDKGSGDIHGAIVIEPNMNGVTSVSSLTTYLFLSKKNYYVKMNEGLLNNKVTNSDVIFLKGNSVYKDCTATCTATSGGVSVTCGDTNIINLP